MNTAEYEHELASLRLKVDKLQVENFRLNLRLKSATLTSSPPPVRPCPEVADPRAELSDRLQMELVKTLTRQLEDERKFRRHAEEERDRVVHILNKLEHLELRMVKDELQTLSKYLNN